MAIKYTSRRFDEKAIKALSQYKKKNKISSLSKALLQLTQAANAKNN